MKPTARLHTGYNGQSTMAPRTLHDADSRVMQGGAVPLHTHSSDT
jgi:hypothetical protein